MLVTYREIPNTLTWAIHNWVYHSGRYGAIGIVGCPMEV